MTSISQTLNAFLDRVDTVAEANRISHKSSAPSASVGGVIDSESIDARSGAGSVNAGDSKPERSLEESKAAKEESDASSIGCISDAGLPSLGDRCNDPCPDRIKELVEEHSQIAHRGHWPAPQTFSSCPAPAPFDPKDHRADTIEGERNRSELKGLRPVSAWLERFLNRACQVRLVKNLSKKQLTSYIDELRASIGAVHEIATRRPGFLPNQDQCRRHAARVVHNSSDRARKQFSTRAEERVSRRWVSATTNLILRVRW